MFFTVVSIHYVEKISIPCYTLVKEKAKQYVESGAYQRLYTEKLTTKTQEDHPTHIDMKAERRDERRRKAAGGKGGGGTQGRETKTKSVKKHQRSKQNQDSDSDEGPVANTKRTNPSSIELITAKDIKKCIHSVLEEDGIEYLGSGIAEHLQP